MPYSGLILELKMLLHILNRFGPIALTIQLTYKLG